MPPPARRSAAPRSSAGDGRDAPTAPTERSLHGFSVAVTANRLVHEQSLLFERAGAQVVHLPLVALELSPEAEAQRSIGAAIERPPDVAIFSTGVGTRWLFAIADAAGEGDRFRAALAHAHVVARGPKARGALATAGVRVDWHAPDALGTQVVDHLAERFAAASRDHDGHARHLHGPNRHEVLIQLDGVSDHLAHRVAKLGCEVTKVRTYRCSPTTTGPDLVAAFAGLDAVTFTSPVAVDGLVRLGGDRLADLRERLAAMVVAAVGPVTAAALERIGVADPVVPDDHRLGAMVRATSAALVERVQPLADGVELRGSAVVIDGQPTTLAPGELRLLRALVAAGGSVVGKGTLARAAGVASPDTHAVEAVVTRLRRRLGPAAHLVETVPRRGYRLTLRS